MLENSWKCRNYDWEKSESIGSWKSLKTKWKTWAWTENPRYAISYQKFKKRTYKQKSWIHG